MIRGIRFDQITLDAYTVTGVAGWGLSAWAVTALGIALGGLDSGWIAGWLVYPVLVREWRPSDRWERIQQDAAMTLIGALGLLATLWLLSEPWRQVPPLLRLLSDPWREVPPLLEYLPVVTAMAGALHPDRPRPTSQENS